MKCPSRREQPGDARAVPRHRPVAGLPALCCPFTSCTYHLGRDHRSLKKLCPPLPAMRTATYFLGTTVHLGPFFGSKSGDT